MQGFGGVLCEQPSSEGTQPTSGTPLTVPVWMGKKRQAAVIYKVSSCFNIQESID